MDRSKLDGHAAEGPYRRHCQKLTSLKAVGDLRDLWNNAYVDNWHRTR